MMFGTNPENQGGKADFSFSRMSPVNHWILNWYCTTEYSRLVALALINIYLKNGRNTTSQSK